MHEHFKQSSGIGLSGIDGTKPDRVPPSTMEHGTRRVKDRMPGIGNAINDHLYRQSEKELVQEIFYSTGAEFGSRNLQRSLAVQFAMRFTHPFARLVAIVPDVLRCSKNPS
jgi:hypothetical protein